MIRSASLENLVKPKRLSYILLLIVFILTAVLFYPISQVFRGEWKLNQQFEIFDFGSLNLPLGIFTIRFYSICILVGLIAGYILTLYISKLHFIAETVIDRMFIGLIIFGLAGARLFFVIFNWEKFSNSPLEIITEINRGGLAIFGALIVGFFYIYLYCRKYNFNLFELLDVLIPGVLLGQIIGRFGNFFNYESYGPPTSLYWKMYVPQTASYYFENINDRFFHPTFLYEIILNSALLIYLLYRYEFLTRKNSGLVFATYCVGYGIIRFIVEFFRIDALIFNLPKFMHLKIGPFITQVNGQSGQIGPFVLEKLLVSQSMALILVILGVYINRKRIKVIFLKKNATQFTIS